MSWMRGGGRTYFLVGILALGALAGCVGGDEGGSGRTGGARPVVGVAPDVWTVDNPILSQPLFPKFLFEHLPLKASDGIMLDSWLFRPDTPPDVKVPTIVHLSPYFAGSLPRGGGGMEKMMRENFTARGYAVLAHSVRGTGFSEGCFEIGGPRERQDTIELFEHIAKQPWSNGNVGLIGVSYDGTAPQGALIAASPHLKTIVPIAAISEWYKYNFIKGVQINPQGYAFNTYYVALESVAPNIHPSQSGPIPYDPTFLPQDIQTYSTRPCATKGESGVTRGPTAIDVQRAQFMTAFTGTTDPYWEERNFTRFLDRVKPNVSVLVVHGLVDYNVKTHNLLPWVQELENHGIPTKYWLGQWGHAYATGWNMPNGRSDWNITLLRWFDYWLKGIDTGIMDEPRADIQDYHGIWRLEDKYPPSRVNPTRYFFGPDGTLKTDPVAGTASFPDDGTGPDIADVRPGPPNFVAYKGPVLAEPFRYSGEAMAHLELAHSTTTGHIAVTVYNVTGTQWKPVNWGFYNYNIRNNPNNFDPLTPGQKFVLNVPLLPTDMVIPGGSQLAVVFSAVNTGGPGMTPPPSGGTTTITLGPQSWIEFPVLDGITPMNPQPLNQRGKPATFSSG